MNYTLEKLESKIDDVTNAMWNLAVEDCPLSNEQVKWLATCYDAKVALHMIHDQMLEKEACKQCEMEEKMQHHHDHHEATPATAPIKRV